MLQYRCDDQGGPQPPKPPTGKAATKQPQETKPEDEQETEGQVQ